MKKAAVRIRKGLIFYALSIFFLSVELNAKLQIKFHLQENFVKDVRFSGKKWFRD